MMERSERLRTKEKDETRLTRGCEAESERAGEEQREGFDELEMRIGIDDARGERTERISLAICTKGKEKKKTRGQSRDSILFVHHFSPHKEKTYRTEDSPFPEIDPWR